MSRDFDLVVVGGGFGGLACAAVAAEAGLRVVVLERSEHVGGAAAYSGGQVWTPANHVAARAGVDDSVEDAVAYVVATQDGRPELLDRERLVEWLTNARLAARHLEAIGALRLAVIPEYPDYYYPGAEGSRAVGRYLTSVPSLAAELGDDAGRLRRSPHFPSGITYAEMLAHGRTSETLKELLAARRAAGVVSLGEGLVAQLYAAVRERGVEVRFGDRAIAALLESDRVVGVVAGSGEVRGAVVLATSTFDWSRELVDRWYDLTADEFGSLAPTTLTGDAVAIAAEAGGALIPLPRELAPLLPVYASEPTEPDDPGFRNCFEHCLPHAIVVDRSGRRFCDDSFYRSLAAAVLDDAGGHRPFFMVWDEQHHRRYGLGAAAKPGEPYPPHVRSAPSLRELGAALGVDGEQLEATVAEFNGPAREGRDPRFGRGTNQSVLRFRGDPEIRPNAVLGALEKPPFHGLELRLAGTGIGATGLATGASGRVLRAAGTEIDGLYAIGPTAAPVHAGSSYNSGYTLSRAMTYAYLAALDVAGRGRDAVAVEAA